MTWREVDALTESLKAREKRWDARVGRLGFWMVSMWSSSKPKFEDFMPCDPNDEPLDDAELMNRKITDVMQNLGDKVTAVPTVRTAEDEAFVERMNAKLFGTGETER